MRFPAFVTRRSVIIIVVHAAVLSVVVGARGWVMARLLDGRLPVSAFLVDVIGLGGIILALHLLNRGLTLALGKALRPRSRPGRALIHAIAALVLVVVAGPLLIALLQFHPQRIACVVTPHDVGMAEFHNVTVYADGLRLAGWFVPAAGPGRPIILLAHGIGANKQNLLYPASMMHESGYGVFLFDFRAHGDSAGFAATFGLRESRDVKAAHDWLVRNHPGHPVYAVGYSMGGSAVLKAAADYGILDRIVVDSSFSSLENVARATLLKRLGVLATPAWQLGRFWSRVWTGTDLADNCPERYVAALADRSLLIIHGLQDPIIPPAESRRLYEAVRPHPQLWLVANAGHLQSMLDPEYKSRLREFFGKGGVEVGR